MKKALSVLALVIAVALGVQAAGSALRVNVPFEFQAGDQTMPPGVYQMERSTIHNSITLVNQETRRRIFLTTNPVQISEYERAIVVFNKYGDRIFLSQVRVGSWGVGQQFRKSKVERELASIYTPQPVVAAAYK